MRNRFHSLIVGLIVCVAALIGGCSVWTPQVGAPSPGAPEAARSAAVLVSELTGTDATTDTAAKWGVGATDLGIMWEDGVGGILMAFGDTFAAPGSEGAGTGDWRSNVLLRSSDTSLDDGVTFDWALSDVAGHAKEILGSAKIPGLEHTVIPTAAIAVNGRNYLAHMSVREWGEAGAWRTNFSRIAFSDDAGSTWSAHGGPEWVNTDAWDDPFQMLAFAADGGLVYVFGTPNGRSGPASLARVPGADLLDQDRFGYWDGAGWSRSEVAAVPVIPAPVAELSVRRDPSSGLWQAIYLNGDADLVLRIASAPTGPWGPEQVIATQQDYPGLYGGFIHPWSPPGEIYLAMSVWNQYNVALMRVRINEAGGIVDPNLVANPSFEWAGPLGPSAGWVIRGNGSLGGSPADAKVGRQCARLGGTPGTSELSQAVSVDPGVNYRVTVWTRSVGVGPTEGRIGVRGTGEHPAALAEVQIRGTTGWTRTVVDFSVGESSPVEVFVTANTMDGEFLVDDVGVVAVGTA